LVFKPKTGQATHTTAKYFRPISLTSFLLKSFERMIRATIDPTQISEAQHACTKGKSTEKSLSIKKFTLIDFLDIEGAFNNVLPIALTESLTELGVEPPMVGLIHKLLISRMVTATLGTSAQTRLVKRGTPQGSVLSHLLWNIAVNKHCGFWREVAVR